LEYISTRGEAPNLGFFDTTLTGLARDGGLYVPKNCPKLSDTEIENMAHQSYLEIAHRVILPFVADDICSADLIKLLKKTYRVFENKEIAPLYKLEDNFYVMELFHGPTLAFKDVALQFLGHIFEYILERKKQKLTIIGATSGDTGSAAIDAFKGRDNINIFILHPKGKVSEVQRRQMTTVLSPNVFNIAIEGNFDDCQDIVKAMFNNQKFRDEMNLSAVNSINWARILAQVVYYIYNSVRLYNKTGKKITFSVPTGNFGNIYAGYIAKSMGAPIEKFIVATNENDILYRFFKTGEMKMDKVTPTLSPSMDIQISSNFERLLFDLYGRKAFSVKQTMKYFRDNGPFKIDDNLMAELKKTFTSYRVSDDETLGIIKNIYNKYNYIIDPHTAVAIGAAEEYQKKNPENLIVSLSTAHASKFPYAIKKSINIEPSLPERLKDIFDRDEKYDILKSKRSIIEEYIRNKVN